MDLGDLYQQLILDHNARPRNYREILGCAHVAVGVNPLCGDMLKVALELDAEGVRIADVAFIGSGCAISKASASIMTECVKGKTNSEALTLFEYFHDLVTGSGFTEPAQFVAPAKLQAFAGVQEFPARVKCASLAWHTLKAALLGQESATTE